MDDLYMKVYIRTDKLGSKCEEIITVDSEMDEDELEKLCREVALNMMDWGYERVAKRVQRKRSCGWRMPPNTVSVCRPGKFGNPFRVTKERTAEEAVRLFEEWLTSDRIEYEPKRKARLLDSLHELHGKDIACWCKEGTPCHADVLLRLLAEGGM